MVLLRFVIYYRLSQKPDKLQMMLYPDNLTLVDDLVSYHAIGADQEHRFAGPLELMPLQEWKPRSVI